MALNQNQFEKQVVIGQIDLSGAGISRALTFRIDPDSSDSDVIPGTGVALKDGGANDAGGVPYVDTLANDTTVANAGIILYTAKQGKFQPGEIVQCAQVGDVVWMNSKAALARGAEVALEDAAPGNVQALGSNAKIGITLDKATAADQLIRVRIETAVAST